MDIGFVGIGRMGRPIALCLLRNGHRLSVFDINRQALDTVQAAGAHVSQSPADLARRCDVIFVCVPGPKEVDAVFNGRDGLFSSIAAGRVVVEMSTIGAVQGKAIAAEASRLGADMLDAPLSGGEAGAAAGKLTAMVGGDQAVLARIRPCLEAFCSNIYHLGANGSGYVAKAINQIIYLSYVASFSEAVALGRCAGLDVGVLLDALRTSVAGQPLVTGWDAKLRSGDISPGFKVSRVIKDLEMGEEACRATSFNAEIFSRVLQEFRHLATCGYSESDVTALYRHKAAP